VNYIVIPDQRRSDLKVDEVQFDSNINQSGKIINANIQYLKK
jgi:hypothetical protein